MVKLGRKSEVKVKLNALIGELRNFMNSPIIYIERLEEIKYNCYL